ncbi:MAG: hypothetical protein JWR75_722 [Devosia sp.]|nr:hypothetical protein [Devosia sp.]
MLTFTTELAGRTRRELPLTLKEASEMAAVGFRFAEFNLEQQRFRLSQPFEVLLVPDNNRLTISQ